MDFSSILDELMGKERDVPLNQQSGRGIKFNDKEVCKYQLCGLCPYRLFKNTKSDLGPCGYEVHDDHIEWEQIKKEWDKLDLYTKDRYEYERDLCRLLESLVKDMDRKIEKAQERAAQESLPKELKADEQARLDDIKLKERESQQKAEQLAEQGDIDNSMIFTQQAEQFKASYDTLYKQLTAGDKTMDVCTVCGVFINSTDNDQRRQDHLNGKQYQGWEKIREKSVELSKHLKKLREAEETEEYLKNKEKNTSRERQKEGEGERERYKRRRSPSPWENRDRYRGDRRRGREESPPRKRREYSNGYYGRDYGSREFRDCDTRDYRNRDAGRWFFDKRVR